MNVLNEDIVAKSERLTAHRLRRRAASGKRPIIVFAEIAQILKVSLQQLRQWANAGLLPDPVEQKGGPLEWRWDRETMVKWITDLQADLAKARRSRL